MLSYISRDNWRRVGNSSIKKIFCCSHPLLQFTQNKKCLSSQLGVIECVRIPLINVDSFVLVSVCSCFLFRFQQLLIICCHRQRLHANKNVFVFNNLFLICNLSKCRLDRFDWMYKYTVVVKSKKCEKLNQIYQFNYIN